MRSRTLVSLLALTASAGVACTGMVDGGGRTGNGPPASPGNNGSPGNGNPGNPGNGNPGNPGNGNPGNNGNPSQPTKPVDPGTPADPNAAGPMAMRRLTHREYNNTVRDLLGVTSNPADMFPSDHDSEFLYRRAGVVTGADFESLSGAAESIAAGLGPKIPMIAPCTGDEAACARTFITSFGLRAFRRPLATEESDRLFALYQTGRAQLMLNYAGAISLLVEAMLQAPPFIYHWELGYQAPTVEGKVIRLNHYEVASRLSYFIWGSLPDADLFAAAAGGKLGTQPEVEAQARRMLTDPRARESVTAFTQDWMNLDQVVTRPKDQTVYPEWKDDLKTAMDAEMRAFVTNQVFDGDHRLDTLLTTTATMVNAPLAAVYGMTGVTGTAMKPAMLNPAERSGLLTRAGFLTVTGAADGSNPVKRGRRVYERLLCGELPPPPPDVPPPKTAASGGTTRERFSEHSAAACARACHSLMDPIGFAFEHYDGIGKYRNVDNGGQVDSTGAIQLDGAERKFADARELSAALAKSPEVARCFAMQWMRFAFQRPTIEEDRASLDAATTAFNKAGAITDLLVGVAGSRTFRYRMPNAGEKLP
jgi:hypothetical protein